MFTTAAPQPHSIGSDGNPKWCAAKCKILDYGELIELLEKLTGIAWISPYYRNHPPCRQGEMTMRKEELIASRVPQDLLADLKRIERVEHLDRSTSVRRLLYAAVREWKLEHASKRYRENQVTLAKAAQEAGVSVREMMEYLRETKVPLQYDADDFKHDLKAIRSRSRKK